MKLEKTDDISLRYQRFPCKNRNFMHSHKTIVFHDTKTTVQKLILDDSNFWFSEETEEGGVQPLTVSRVYLAFLESPKYKFLRDTLSYIIMLVLHYALCLSPSSIAFSGLEWAILAFYIGRYLVELKQISGVKQFLTRSRQKEDDNTGLSCLKLFSVYFR